METTLRHSTRVMTIRYSLNHGATNEEAEAWLQEHAAKNDFRENMAMHRNNGGVIGHVEHIDEKSAATRHHDRHSRPF